MSGRDIPGPSTVGDGVSIIAADASHLRSYQEASDALARFKVPGLSDPENPHERLFIALFVRAD